MVVAKGYGVDLTPDLTNPGEFDYPQLHRIPG
jgi:hypothetical protein